MEARCLDSKCQLEWVLQKSPRAYKDGPRCPACGSREIEIEEPEHTDESVSAQAFQRFKKGDGPAELVEQGLCSPSRARELFQEFEELAEPEVRIIPEEEFQGRIESAKEEGKSEIKHRSRKTRKRANKQIDNLQAKIEELQHENNRIRKQFSQEYEAGFKDGQDYGYELAVEDYDDLIDEIREQKNAEIRKLESIVEERLTEIENLIDDQEGTEPEEAEDEQSETTTSAH